MDSGMLKILLETHENAYKNTLEIFLKKMDVKFESLTTTTNDLSRSLEFTQSEVDELRHQVKQLERAEKDYQERIKCLTEELKDKNDRLEDLEERCNYQEDYSRRNNLHIAGIEESEGETWEQTAVRVTKLLEEKLELPNLEVERAHRVGNRTDHRHRPIIARFTRFCDREAVLRNAAKLRGTKIYLNEDLCAASQYIKKQKMPLLKQARSEGKIAYFRHTKLIIKERQGTRRLSGSAAACQPAISDASIGTRRTGGAAALAGGEPLRSDASLGAGRVEGATAAGQPLYSGAPASPNRVNGDNGASTGGLLHSASVPSCTSATVDPSTRAADTDGEDSASSTSGKGATPKPPAQSKGTKKMTTRPKRQ